MEQQADLIVRGRLVLPGGEVRDGELVIRDGRIVAAGDPPGAWTARQTLDVGQRLVLPGVIDGHVHALSDPTEGITAATTAAASGGVTTIIEMPFDAGAPINSAERLLAKRERVAQEAVVDVALLATLRKRGGLDQVAPLAAAGACGFKLSLFETDSERFPQIPDDELLQAFRLIAETGLLVGVHAENTDVITSRVAELRAAGRTDGRAHCESRPNVSETEAILRALEFAQWAGARIHIFHVSLPRGVELANWYRSQGVPATTETCPHYLLLNEDDMPRLHAQGKINPPLRRPADSAGLWEQLADGRIDLATSDHAPWKPEKKNKPDIFDNASGTPGVETLLPLIYSEGVAKGRLSLARLVSVLCERPAELFGLAGRKGRLAPGADADFVVLDPEARWTLSASLLRSVAGWTPYEGLPMQGRVTHTYVRGQPVVVEGDLVGGPGSGQFQAPAPEGALTAAL
jgi:allantoinase